MTRRPVRILVVLMTIAVTGGLIWKVTTNEQARGRLRAAGQRTDLAAANALVDLADLRATLHAYPAPGQGLAFWSQRAEAHLASMKGRLRDLEPAAADSGQSLAAIAEALETLAGTERRARMAAGQGQMLLAADIVFTEAHPLIEAAMRDLSDARQAMARVASVREAGSANEQSLLAGTLIAVWIFALILLVPVPDSPAAAPATPLIPVPGNEADLALHEAAPAALGRPAARQATAPPDATPDAVPQSDETAAARTGTDELRRLAELCAEIGRVTDASELDPLLARAAALLGVPGVVVWLASGAGLAPAASHGYDPKLLARLGRIVDDDQNLTATAFRTGRARLMAARGESPGALAVPLQSATGPIGVLTAEVPVGVDGERAAAMAGIVGAQLAALFPPAAVSPDRETARPA